MPADASRTLALWRLARRGLAWKHLVPPEPWRLLWRRKSRRRLRRAWRAEDCACLRRERRGARDCKGEVQ